MHVRSIEDVTVLGTLSSDCGALLLVAVVRRVAEQQESLVEQDTRAALPFIMAQTKKYGACLLNACGFAPYEVVSNFSWH